MSFCKLWKMKNKNYLTPMKLVSIWVQEWALHLLKKLSKRYLQVPRTSKTQYSSFMISVNLIMEWTHFMLIVYLKRQWPPLLRIAQFWLNTSSLKMNWLSQSFSKKSQSKFKEVTCNKLIFSITFNQKCPRSTLTFSSSFQATISATTCTLGWKYQNS